MEQTYEALRDRLYRAFDKITKNTLVLTPDGEGISAENAVAAAKLVERILDLDAAIAAKTRLASNTNAPTATPATMGSQPLREGQVPVPVR